MWFPITPAFATRLEQESNLKTVEAFLDLDLDLIDKTVQAGFAKNSALEGILIQTLKVQAYIIDVLLKMLGKDEPRWLLRIKRIMAMNE